MTNPDTLPNLAELFERFKKHMAEKKGTWEPMGLIQPGDHYTETEHLRDQIKKEKV